MSGSLKYISRSHALAWERILDVPTSREARKPTSVPTPARGNQKKRDTGANQIGSHAGAWEPENKYSKSEGLDSNKYSKSEGLDSNVHQIEVTLLQISILKDRVANPVQQKIKPRRNNEIMWHTSPQTEEWNNYLHKP